MNTATKLGGFLAALAVVFAAAVGVGNAVGPVGPAADRTPAMQTETGDSDTDTGTDMNDDMDMDMDMDMNGAG